VLTLPPAITARMAMTIDSISQALRREPGHRLAEGRIRPDGLWPGEEHFQAPLRHGTEYVTVMKELWEKGQSDFKGRSFTMNDCRLGPLPSHPIG